MSWPSKIGQKPFAYFLSHQRGNGIKNVNSTLAMLTYGTLKYLPYLITQMCLLYVG